MLPDAFQLWTAGWRVGMDMAETSLASAQVIAARMPMIAAAATGSRSHDRELTRMVTEKMTASSAAGLSLWQAWAGMATGNSGAVATAMMDATKASLAPFHAGATANAKRLGRKKRRYGGRSGRFGSTDSSGP